MSTPVTSFRELARGYESDFRRLSVQLRRLSEGAERSARELLNKDLDHDRVGCSAQELHDSEAMVTAEVALLCGCALKRYGNNGHPQVFRCGRHEVPPATMVPRTAADVNEATRPPDPLPEPSVDWHACGCRHVTYPGQMRSTLEPCDRHRREGIEVANLTAADIVMGADRRFLVRATIKAVRCALEQDVSYNGSHADVDAMWLRFECDLVPKLAAFGRAVDETPPGREPSTDEDSPETDANDEPPAELPQTLEWKVACGCSLTADCRRDSDFGCWVGVCDNHSSDNLPPELEGEAYKTAVAFLRKQWDELIRQSQADRSSDHS